MGLSTSGEAAHAYLDWLTVVARDEIAALWPHVEKVAHALVRERMAAAEVKALPGVRLTPLDRTNVCPACWVTSDAALKPPCWTNVGRLYPPRADN